MVWTGFPGADGRLPIRPRRGRVCDQCPSFLGLDGCLLLARRGRVIHNYHRKERAKNALARIGVKNALRVFLPRHPTSPIDFFWNNFISTHFPRGEFGRPLRMPDANPPAIRETLEYTWLMAESSKSGFDQQKGTVATPVADPVLGERTHRQSSHSREE